MEQELDEAEDARTLAGTVSDEYREGVWHVLSDLFDEASEADALLKAVGLPLLDHDSVDFGGLCRRFLVAKQEYLKIEADRWEGNYAPRRNGSTLLELLHQHHPSPQAHFSVVQQSSILNKCHAPSVQRSNRPQS